MLRAGSERVKEAAPQLAAPSPPSALPFLSRLTPLAVRAATRRGTGNAATPAGAAAPRPRSPGSSRLPLSA